MARIERVNYDTYIKPLEHIQKAHNDTLADMANMSQQSEILDYYLDPELDKESYNLYNNFKNEFNAQATDFAKNGYTRNNGARLLNLHRNYNRNVGNVLDAVKNREAERAEQHKLFADSNGQVVFGNGQNADEKSVDDYLRGNKGYVFQNLDEVYKYAKNQAAAASKREYKDGVADAVRVLDNNYYKILEETGYDTQAAYEKLDAMMADVANQLDLTYNPNNDTNIDPKNDPAGLIRNMREELRRRGLENYSNEDKHKIISSFLTGTYEGLGYEPKLTLKDTPEMRKAGAAKTNVVIKGEGEPPQDDMNVSYDWVTTPSDFKNERATEQQQIFDAVSNGKAFPSIMSDLQFMFKSAQGGHGLCTEDEFLYNKWGYEKFVNKDNSYYYKNVKGDGRSKFSFKADGSFDESNSTRKLFEFNRMKNEYAQSYNLIGDTYHLKKGSNGKFPLLEQMKNPQTKSETFESEISSIIANNARYAKPQKTLGTRLKIDPENMNKVVGKALTNNEGRPLGTDLSYNPHTGMYKFNNATDISDAFEEAKHPEWTICRLHFLPTESNKGANQLYVEIKNKGVENGKSFFMPLDIFEAYSDAEKTKQLHDWSQEELAILKRNINGLKESFGTELTQKYGINNIDALDVPTINKIASLIRNDKSMNVNNRNVLLDYLAQAREALLYIDFYRHQELRAASEGAYTTVQEAVDDLKNNPAKQKNDNNG